MEKLIFKGKSGQFYIADNVAKNINEMSENFRKNYVTVEIDGISFRMDKYDDFESNGLRIYIEYNLNICELTDRGVDNIPAILYNQTGNTDFFLVYFRKID